MAFPAFEYVDIGASTFWQSGCYTGTMFCIVSQQHETAAISPTGAPGTWSIYTTPFTEIASVCGYNDNICAIGPTDSLYSTDGGVNWALGTVPLNGVWLGCARSPTRIVAVSNVNAGSGCRCATSDDNGATFTERLGLSTAIAWEGVVWTGTSFIAVGGSSYSISTDGVTWSGPTAFNTSGMVVTNAVMYGSRVVVCGYEDFFAYSDDDGATWAEGATPTGLYQYSRAIANGFGVLITYNAFGIFSEDGTGNWEQGANEIGDNFWIGGAAGGLHMILFAPFSSEILWSEGLEGLDTAFFLFTF